MQRVFSLSESSAVCILSIQKIYVHAFKKFFKGECNMKIFALLSFVKIKKVKRTEKKIEKAKNKVKNKYMSRGK